MYLFILKKGVNNMNRLVIALLLTVNIAFAGQPSGTRTITEVQVNTNSLTIQVNDFGAPNSDETYVYCFDPSCTYVYTNTAERSKIILSMALLAFNNNCGVSFYYTDVVGTTKYFSNLTIKK